MSYHELLQYIRDAKLSDKPAHLVLRRTISELLRLHPKDYTETVDQAFELMTSVGFFQKAYEHLPAR
jgi:hypothetical protein